MKFYDETKPLYIKTDASGVGPGAALLQTRKILALPRMKLQKTALRPVAFTSKSLIRAEKKIQQYRKRSTRHTIQA